MKNFNVRHCTVMRRYYVSFHDGESKHKDGSPFYGMKILKNKKDLQRFTKELLANGYKEG